MNDLLMVRYEDMRTQPEQTMLKILEFTGCPGSSEQIRETVEFAAYQNMKKHEEKKLFLLISDDLVPDTKTILIPVRLGEQKLAAIGDYFDEQQIQTIDEFMQQTLSPLLGYTVNS